MGKVLSRYTTEKFTVTGVMADLPDNSHLQFDFIMPMRFYARTSGDFINNVWDNFNYYTYVQLAPGASVEKVNRQVNDLLKKNEKKLNTIHGWGLNKL